jgi:hypothetical protein
MTVMLRKHCSIERQKEVTRAAYDATHADNWQVIIPFVVRYALHPEWKVRNKASLMKTLPYSTRISVTITAINLKI